MIEKIDGSNDEKKNKSRFTRANQVVMSYHDFVCYSAVDQNSGLQVFWYEFINDKMRPERIEQGFKQLQQALKITSPHLLNILDVSQTVVPPRFCVITEAIKGPTLFDYLHSIESPPSMRIIIKWFKLLALAVQALHKGNITHGFISLKNVYIKPSTGTIKLRFPLTHLSNRQISPSSININQYTSPELLNGSFSKSTDIWSLGICFLELITQTTAYQEYETPNELISAIHSMKLPNLIHTIKNLEVATLIKNCLSPEVARPTIDQLLENPIFQILQTPIQQAQEINGSIQIIVQNDEQMSPQ